MQASHEVNLGSSPPPPPIAESSTKCEQPLRSAALCAGHSLGQPLCAQRHTRHPAEGQQLCGGQWHHHQADAPQGLAPLKAACTANSAQHACADQVQQQQCASNPFAPSQVSYHGMPLRWRVHQHSSARRLSKWRPAQEAPKVVCVSPSW